MLQKVEKILLIMFENKNQLGIDTLTLQVALQFRVCACVYMWVYYIVRKAIITAVFTAAKYLIWSLLGFWAPQLLLPLQFHYRMFYVFTLYIKFSRKKYSYAEKKKRLIQPLALIKVDKTALPHGWHSPNRILGYLHPFQIIHLTYFWLDILHRPLVWLINKYFSRLLSLWVIHSH